MKLQYKIIKTCKYTKYFKGLVYKTVLNCTIISILRKSLWKYNRMAGSTQKYLTVITAVIETLLTSCIIYGWAAMDYILTQEGYFAAACNSTALNKTATPTLCPSQQYSLELVYTLSAVLSAIVGIIGGVIMDRFGTMVFRNLATFFFVASCLAVAFSTPQISWVLYPAMITLASSGWLLYISALQTANLFPRFRGTIVNIINGALDASLVIFSIVKAAYQAGISLKAIFLFMGIAFGIFALIRTFLLMPKMVLPYEVPDDFSYGISEYCKGTKSSSRRTSEEEALLLDQKVVANSKKNGDNKLHSNDKDTNAPKLKEAILNSLYILGTFSMVVQWFRCSFFIEALNGSLKFMLPHNPKLVSYDVSLFGYIQVTAILFAPLNGAIFDTSLYFFSKRDDLSSTQAKLKSLVIVCLFASTCSIIYSIFSLIDNPGLEYVSFILYVLADTFPEANLSLLLIQFFPMKQFGTLYGLVSIFIGLATAMQYPFFFVALRYFNGNFFVVNVIALILVILTLAHPANLYRKSRTYTGFVAGDHCPLHGPGEKDFGRWKNTPEP